MSLDDLEKNLDELEGKVGNAPEPAAGQGVVQKVVSLLAEHVSQETYVKMLPDVIEGVKAASERMDRVAAALERPDPLSGDVKQLGEDLTDAIRDAKPTIPEEVTVKNPVTEIVVKNMPQIPGVPSFISKGLSGIVEKLTSLPEAIAERIKAVGTSVTVVNKEPIEVVLTHEGKRYKATGGGSAYAATAGAGSPIGLRSGVSTAQVRIAVTNTRVQFPSYPCTNGLIITNNGSSDVTIGGSTVTNTTDGTGNGYILVQGASVSAACDDSSDLYVNGSAGGYISFIVT